MPDGISEFEFQRKIQKLAKKNKLFSNYIGLGYHPAIVPAVIQRNILENPGWYTAYTPYQAEIAQGRLEALFNYQTVIADLTGMELANASLLDESTAAAEAMALLYAVRTRDQKKNNVQRFFIDENTLPQTIALLKTRQTHWNRIGHWTPRPINESFGAIFQYPGKHGNIIDLPKAIEKATSLSIKTVVAADLFALTLLEALGNMV